MPKTIEGKERRLGVPPVRESYGDMQKAAEMEEQTSKRERKKTEKLNEHLEHEKIQSYIRHLPPAENAIMSERPPFKKK